MQTYTTSAAVKMQHRAKFPREVRDLAELLGITPEFAGEQDLETRLAILKTLDRALKVEVQRGATRQDFPAYDVNRHLNICVFMRKEIEALRGRPNLALADIQLINDVLSQIIV